MSSTTELIRRLLHVYPIKIVKEEFELSGNAKDVIDILVGDKTQARLKQFAREKHAHTKQHIYLFELNGTFRKNKLEDFPFAIVHQDFPGSGNNGSFFCLPQVKFKVLLSNPLEKDEIVFLLPMTCVVKDRIVQMHFSKMERNVQRYFPADRDAQRMGKSTSELGIFENCRAFFNANFGVKPLDINVGVKYLWEEDYIDGRKVQWRNDSSVVVETMDEELTFKQQYPDQYEELIQKPLVKSYFKYIMHDDYFCQDFHIDSEQGFIDIPKSPKEINQISNVIRKILENN